MTEHWYIPKHEQVELDDALADAPDICDDLNEAMKPRIATATWNPKVTTGDRPQPLPYNVAALDAADQLAICLEGWAYWLANTRNITPPNSTIKSNAAFLRRHLLLLAATEGSADAHRDITSEIRHARNASGRGHLQPIPKPDPTRVEQARSELLNANGCATLAKLIGVQGLTQKRVNNLKLRGHITPVNHTQIGKKQIAIYRLGDVLDAHYKIGTWQRQPTG